MKVSVALATYNGVRYLDEQLRSFARQSRLPDELIVSDDGSHDGTPDLLEAFGRSAPFPVTIVRGTGNVGYTANFERAMARCSGDFVFLSDQDDVWEEHKIQQVLDVFARHPDKLVVVHDAMITFADLRPSGLTVAGQHGATGTAADQLFIGCCMALRADMTRLALPIFPGFTGHDGWIHGLASVLDVVHFEPQVLQLYRRHGTNTSTWPTNRTTRASGWHLLREKLRWRNLRGDPRLACDRRIAQLDALRERLESRRADIGAWAQTSPKLDQALGRIDRQRAINAARRAVQQQAWPRRTLEALKFYLRGGYSAFEGWKSLARDVLR